MSGPAPPAAARRAAPARPARAVTAGRAAACLLFLATLPVWIPVALVVWASVGRPLLFRQVRSGLETRPFTICKFRTMRDIRDGEGRLLPDRLRETAATRRLRRLRIDELPQLLAVMRGDMAFVGPRPLLPATIAGFGEHGRLRCSVRPGLSGWAQVNGNTRLGEREKLALDLWYVRHRSGWLNARILARTILVLLRGEHPNAAALRLAAGDAAGAGGPPPPGGASA